MSPPVSARKSSHPHKNFRQAPKMVVQTVSEHLPTSTDELSFHRGDFLYIVSDPNDAGQFYDAINPLTKARGIINKALCCPVKKYASTSSGYTSRQTTSGKPSLQTTAGILGGEERYRKGPKSAPISGYRTDHIRMYAGGGTNVARMQSYPSQASMMKPLPRTPQPSSPISPKSHSFQDTNSTGIQTVTIQAVNMKEDGKFTFTILVRRENGQNQLLFRQFVDFHALHLSLLNHFPVESGRKGQARCIPFLPDNHDRPTSALAQEQKRSLDVYLDKVLKLRTRIRESKPVIKFLTPRGNDVETANDVAFGDSETLFELIDGYEMGNIVKVSLIASNLRISFNFSQKGTFDELMAELYNRAGVRCVGYLDETKQLTELRDDVDLHVLLTTYPGAIEFHPKRPDGF
ncbi:MAG: hypothetical protein SGCHY_005542 [Lobulomycetales sp.]